MKKRYIVFEEDETNAAIKTVKSSESDKSFVVEELTKEEAEKLKAKGKDVIEDEPVKMMLESAFPTRKELISDIKGMGATAGIKLVNAHQEIGTHTAWEMGITGSNTRVAVLDSGIDVDHEYLSNTQRGKDFTGGDFEDLNFHGTHVAGIICSTGTSIPGVARGCNVFDYRVLDSDGSGYTSDIVEAMRHACNFGIKIVNMSLGTANPSNGTNFLCSEVNRLTEKYNAIFCVAAGNSGGYVGSPAAALMALTVGATKQDSIAFFSSYGMISDEYQKPEVAAPGVNILSTAPGGQRIASGTSMATPFVSGFCALLAQYYSKSYSSSFTSLLKVKVEEMITNSCNTLTNEPMIKQGKGKISIYNAFTGEEPTEKCPFCTATFPFEHTDPCYRYDKPTTLAEYLQEWWRNRT